MTYEIKKVRTPKGLICWGIRQDQKWISFHGDRHGAQIAVRHLLGQKVSVEKANVRWIKNFVRCLQGD